MKILNNSRSIQLRALLLLVLCIGMAGASQIARAAGGEDISPAVRAQIHALMLEKAAFTPAQQKMDSQLVLAAKKYSGGQIAGGAVPFLRLAAEADSEGMILVDINASVTATLTKFITSLGGTVINRFPQFGAIRARVPLIKAETIAARQDVYFVKPAVKALTNVGIVDTEGNVTHRASESRFSFHADGTGVKIGVLSDSVDFIGQSQATGDLGPVTILPGQSGVPGSGEGTAMLEIVHDIAPGAQLYYASGFNGEAQFAQNILDLRAAGCDIIVDDIGYFDESPFQDGIVAQAVNTVTAGGALYFSSAANSGNLSSGTSGTWQGDFLDGGAVTTPVDSKGGNFHSFGAQNYDTAIQPGSAVVLFWSDPAGASDNDYDLYVVDSAGANIVGSSITTQNGNQDPFELAPPAFPQERVVVVKATGAPRFLHLDTIRGELAVGTSGNTKGHAAAVNAFGVAAVNVATAYPNPFFGGTANPVETFSSDGPRRVFFFPDGTPITPGDFSSTGGTVRQKPDIAAADGVSTTVPGFLPFFGTSAAAPHAAAIAGLLKSYNHTLNPPQIRAILTNSALDIMAPGVDRDSGSGIVMAYQAIAAAPIPSPAPNLILTTNIVSGGNANGLIDFNECNNLDLVVTNIGSTNATGVQGTLSTTTPGVSIAQPVAFYPNIPVFGGGTNITPFLVSTTPGFICGTTIDFRLVIKCDQGSFTNIFRVTTGILGPPVRFDSAGPANIPDSNPVGTNSVINVTNVNSAVLGVVVSVNISHTYDADLVLQLIGPDGTTVNLSRNNGGSGDNYGIDCADANRTIFADSASNSITTSSAPFIGFFRPEEALSAFNGKAGTNVNGIWKLHAADLAPPDVGTIQCWSLILSTANCIDGGGQCPGADLGLGLKANVDPVFIGTNLVYSILVTNNGPDTAKGVAMNVDLPPSAIFVTASSSQGSYVQSGSSVGFNLGNMPVGTVASATIIVTPTTAGNIFCTASVGALQPDFDPSNNSATISTRVDPPTADLAISLGANPNPATLGGVLTYTIGITNNGPSGASGVVVTNIIPANTVFLSATPSQGTYFLNGDRVVCSLGTLQKNGTAFVLVSVRPTALGSISDTATVSAAQPDSVPGNNTRVLVVPVTPASDLAVSIASVPTSVIFGARVTYELSVVNFGPSAAASVSVNNTLPANTLLVGVTNNQGSYTQTGSSVTCTITNLAVGGVANIYITVDTTPLSGMTPPVTITDSASVLSTQSDPNTANNSASASTVVDTARVTIVAAGAVLTKEGLGTTNASVDIGETVTVSLGLLNSGNRPNTNLVATLLGIGGVSTNVSQVQTYGMLPPGGTNVFRSFTFTASGTNGGNVVATLQLLDGPNILPPVTFTFGLPKVSRFFNTNTITIPDVGSATPYPSTNLVSGLSGTVGKVSVTLTNFNHTFSDDVGILLVGPNAASASQRVVLLSHVGANNAVSAASVTFDDAAASSIGQTSQITSGTNKPSVYGSVSFPAAAPNGPYQSNLSTFNGINPNGTWSLYVVDSHTGDMGAIVGGWSLGITTLAPVNGIADLSVKNVATPAAVGLTDYLTNTFTITNGGPSMATGVSLTNQVSSGADVFSVITSKGTAGTNGSGVPYALIGNLSTGTTATVTIVVTPTIAGNLASVTSQGTVTAVETDLNFSNNVATTSTTVTRPQVDVALSISGAPNPVVVGSNLTYTVGVTNNGPGTALGVIVTDPLPGSFSYVSGIVSPPLGVISNLSGAITCNLGNLAVGAGVALTINVVPNQSGAVANTASVSTASTDTIPANNSATSNITVQNAAPLMVPAGANLISESARQNKTIEPGETVTINLALANIGSADATNLLATLVATNGLIPITYSNAYGTVVHGGAGVSRPFTFTSPSGGNGGVVTAVLHLEDGSIDLGNVTFSFNLPSTNAFGNGTAINIPDNGPATPYPSSVNVSGLTGVVTAVTITLSNVNHAFPDDMDVLLVDPSGRSSIIMSDAGGSHGLTNVTLTFDDNAVSLLPDADQIVSGIFKPSDFESGDYFASPAALGPYTASLANFIGASPNGTWSLYVFDDSPGDNGNIAGWSLKIATVNPVNSAADLGLSLANPVSKAVAASTFSITLKVSNRGPDVALGVVLTDVLPPDFSFLGALTLGSYSYDSGILTVNVGNILPDGSSTVTIFATSPMPGIYTNNATVTSDAADLNVADNALSTVFSVGKAAKLSASTIQPDGSFTLTLTGQPGQAYGVQSSTNLVDWETISTNTANVSGKFTFTDPNTGGEPVKFYRTFVIE